MTTEDVRGIERKAVCREGYTTTPRQDIGKDKIVFIEGHGDRLHTQANALDSAFLFDMRVDYDLFNAMD